MYRKVFCINRIRKSGYSIVCGQLIGEVVTEDGITERTCGRCDTVWSIMSDGDGSIDMRKVDTRNREYDWDVIIREVE